jgi:hypothetical protein
MRRLPPFYQVRTTHEPVYQAQGAASGPAYTVSQAGGYSGGPSEPGRYRANLDIYAFLEL